MKKSVYLICALCLFIGMWQACGSQEEVVTTGSIYGTILDKENGEPIRNAGITLSPSSRTTIVGSDGTFEFANVEAEQYSVNVEAEGYEYNTKFVTVIAGKNTICDFHLEKVVETQIIEIMPTSLNFGTTQNQMSMTITNKGKSETTWTLDLSGCKWLSANPISGRIGANKTQAIIFSVDRSLLQKDKTAVVTLSAFGNSYPMDVSCAIVQNKGVMNVSPTVLSFGEDTNEMNFTVKNLGNANLNWYAQRLSTSCLSLSESNGTLTSGASKVVKVLLCRSHMSEDLSTSFVVSDGNTDQEILVMATKKVLRPIVNVTPTMLDFGDSSTSKTFTISNSGNADLNWSLTNINNECLSFSNTSGTISPAGSTTVTITLNRAAMHTDLNTSIGVSDGTNSQSITIKATYVYVEDYSSAKIESCSSDVKAEIVSCKHNGTDVVFTYKLTNIGLGEVNIQIKPVENYTGASVIFDDLGNSYNRQYMTFRNQGNAWSNAIGVAFPEGVPCTGTVTVQNVPKSATTLTVKLGVWINQIMGNIYISFKNVPIY